MLESTLTLYSGSEAANSLCGSRISTRRSGRASMALRSSSDTAVDLPTPVVPTMAKWRASVSSMAMRASIVSSCDSWPMRDGVTAGEIVDRLQVAGADAVRDGADMRDRR